MMNNVVIKQKQSTRGRPKTINYEVTLEIAMNAYWSEGIEQMSVNQVCKLAGVSKPSLYREFGNEDGLLSAVFHHYGKVFRKRLILLLAKQEDFKNSMNELIFFMSYLRDPNTMPKGCLGVKSWNSLSSLGPKSRIELVANSNKLLKIFEDWLERSSKKGFLNDEYSNKFSAEYVHSMFNHGMRMNGNGESPERIKRVMALALSPLVSD